MEISRPPELPRSRYHRGGTINKMKLTDNYQWHTREHAAVKELLDMQLQTGRVAHAYVFMGPEGVGKLTLAQEFASRLGGQRGSVVQFDFATAGLPELRELLARVALKPLGSHQVVICDGAQHISVHTGNALLKTLEEPPTATTFILVSNSRRVLPTIASRCQLVFFGRTSESPVGDSFEAAVGQWQAEFGELVEASVFERGIIAQKIAAESVEQFEARLRAWLGYASQQSERLAARGRVLLEAWDRFQKNGNRKLVAEFLCLNI